MRCTECSIPGYETLKELALDLRWSWNHSTDKIWCKIDPKLWELTHNPWVVLQSISDAKLAKMFQDPTFKKNVDLLLEEKKEEAQRSAWFQQKHSEKVKLIAYFSMEFMLSEALPIYSGGLGNVAGDQLKAASDLGVPVIGVGLLYSQGYFRQIIDKYGNQKALFPYNDPGQLPISPLRTKNGEWLRIELVLPDWSVWIRAWEVQVGKVKLYLLDSNDIANFPAHRGITSELYVSDPEVRLKQELILGMGGWRLLKALGLKAEVCHLNEGHAAFVVLERALSFMEESKLPFDAALIATRCGNLFTTHTAIAQGFDWYSPSLMQDHLRSYAEEKLKISFDDLMALGRDPSQNKDDYFNMAYLAIRGSGAINGVSSLHGKVSRHLFRSLFYHWPENEVPIGAITNGVHMPSWDSPEADDLWTKHCKKCRWREETEALEESIKQASDREIWDLRQQSRSSLIDYARQRLVMQLKGRGAQENEIERAGAILDPNVLTLCFAKRFASYKRPNLLLQDPERFLRILSHPERPVQMILAGKAHPQDMEGQALIKKWMEFIFNNEAARLHVIFLSDYDVLLTEQMVGGADLWINTPKRPWEACGTSGMKVLVNGGLNLSTKDGWWAEFFSPEVGWAIGDETNQEDAKDASALYDLLENEIVPAFYERNEEGISASWVAKIRESMALTPRLSATRAVRDYTETYYIPAAEEFRKRSDRKGSLAKEIALWKKNIEDHWDEVKFGAFKAENNRFEVEVFLGSIAPDAIRVELFANNGLKQEMQRARQIKDGYVYMTEVSSEDPLESFTPRIIPFHPSAKVPLETTCILWQK